MTDTPKTLSDESAQEIEWLEMVDASKYSTLNPWERIRKRNEYIKAQNDKCWYCGYDIYGEPPNKPPIDWSLFPENFLKYPIHLQHDHETDWTEGAVHAYCNAVMWQYEGR